MKSILFLVFIFICSCKRYSFQEASVDETQNLIGQEWIYAYRIQDVKFDGAVITRPPGIFQLVFSLTLPAEGGESLKNHCVYYQVPYKNIPGIIRILEIKMEKSCPEIPSENSWIEIGHVSDLKMILENFRLKFNFLKDQKRINWVFTLPNLENGIIHEKLQPSKERRLYPGMIFLRMGEEGGANKTNRYLGKIDDRFSKGSSIRCHQIDKNCSSIGDNRCDDCAYGWYQVVDYHCPQGGSKFCGQNHCGEKNEPACPRGTKVTTNEELGICQTDLTPSWNSDHILVCL